MSACICDWPDECNGLGGLQCDGCGGDDCVCICGGEMDCPGCEHCEDLPDDWDDDEPTDGPDDWDSEAEAAHKGAL